MEPSPRRILEIGTGTGAGAVWLASRFPRAQVVGVDLSPAMVQAATARRPSQLVYFDDLTRVAAAGGYVIVASSLGPATPYFTPHSLLRRGLERRGLRVVADGQAGKSTFVVAQRPE